VFRVEGLMFRIYGSGLGVKGLRFWGLEFRGQGLRVF
jgi:hypothetical protein